MKINTGVDRNYIHTTSNYTIIIGKLEPDSISHFNASRNNLEKKVEMNLIVAFALENLFYYFHLLFK